MACSGSQLTRIGYGVPMAIAITITPKSPSVITETILDFGRSFMRAMVRGYTR